MRILHIDDDFDIRQLAQLGLAEIGGFEVLQCSSGQEALEQAQDFAPEMILIDMMMPGLDGPETLQRLRQLDGLENTPAAFMTARGVHDAQELAGETDVITKPFDPLTIADEVREVWEKQRA